ncbi:glycosyl hydrolases family 18-domain-containing protein [Jimgerdemannia flammicorona]|uniref:Glycosyl hydrolases family 18-domain-containing protein n=1 Tax=Jimgerdemannia flammicorona TaxID=994334 RepID=A0A433CSF5_9FUNG|nr:glycosyl hydrolases family 18-domain-containing protein [Jimgerdemannia flammicorona]
MKFLLLLTCLAAAAVNGVSAKVVIGYVPSYAFARYHADTIPYASFTHLYYAFAGMSNPTTLLPSFINGNPELLGTIVTDAHRTNTKVILSIGGSVGSVYFSTMVASNTSRKNFVDWNVEFIKQWGTDGVDLDWEYPGRPGVLGNVVDPANDAANLLLLLKELRAVLDENFPNDHKIITMAVRVEPFDGPNGPLKDISEYAKYMDYVNIMAYDINIVGGATTGPNAPFTSEGTPGNRYSYVQAIRDWKSAGFPASQIVAGLAFYGRAWSTLSDVVAPGGAVSQFVPASSTLPAGDSDDVSSGIWKWINLRSQGLLTSSTTGGEGWTRYWDNITQTPFLFNNATKVYISYDDPISLQVKVSYACDQNLAGVMVWDISYDNGELMAATAQAKSCGESRGLFGGIVSVVVPKTGQGPLFGSVAYASVNVQSHGSMFLTEEVKKEPETAKVLRRECESEGAQRCLLADSTQFRTWYRKCVEGMWVIERCGSGGVCQENGDGTCSFFN